MNVKYRQIGSGGFDDRRTLHLFREVIHTGIHFLVHLDKGIIQ